MKKLGSLVANREVYFVRIGQNVLDVARYMAERNVGAVLVLDGDHLAGVFSERDLMKRVLVAGLHPGQTLVEDVMTRDLVTAVPDESHEEGMQKMKQLNVRHLPIVEEGRLFGLVSLRDLLLMELDEKDHELRMMTAYIHDFPQQ
jgi:CBS domain-containing protein